MPPDSPGLPPSLYALTLQETVCVECLKESVNLALDKPDRIAVHHAPVSSSGPCARCGRTAQEVADGVKPKAAGSGGKQG